LQILENESTGTDLQSLQHIAMKQASALTQQPSAPAPIDRLLAVAAYYRRLSLQKSKL